MASTIVGCNNFTGTFSSTYYLQPTMAQICAALFLAEKNGQFDLRRANLTLKNTRIKIGTSTHVGDSTLRTRVNGGNGNALITVGAGGTGYFQDLVNTDVLTNPTLFDYSWVTGGGLATSAEIQSIVSELETTSGPTTYILGAAYNLYNQTNGLTRYTRIVGTLNASGDTGLASETGNVVTYRTRAGGFAKGLQVSIYQATDVDTVITLRKNYADTALTVTIPSGSTTTVIDTTNSVRFAPRDLLNLKIVTASGGAGTLRLASAAIYCESDDDQCDIGATGYNPIVAAGAQTDYACPIGNLTIGASETLAKIKIPFATDIGALQVLIQNAPTGLAPAVFTLRVNGVDSALVLSIAVGASGGWHQSARALSVAVAAGDEISISRVSTDTWNATVYAIGLALNYDPTADVIGGQRGVSC